MPTISAVHGINGTKVGALNELRVCVDLMLRGWDTYRAMSPSSDFDIIACRGQAVLRVEVRTAYERNGKFYGKDKPRTRNGATADVVALITVEKIIYRPELATEPL